MSTDEIAAAMDSGIRYGVIGLGVAVAVAVITWWLDRRLEDWAAAHPHQDPRDKPRGGAR